MTVTSNLKITTPGTYTFYSKSDDGSAIIIGGKEAVTNYKCQGPTEKSASCTLSAGAHAFEGRFTQGVGGKYWIMSWMGPDTGNKKRILSSSDFTDTATPPPPNSFAPPPSSSPTPSNSFAPPPSPSPSSPSAPPGSPSNGLQSGANNNGSGSESGLGFGAGIGVGFATCLCVVGVVVGVLYLVFKPGQNKSALSNEDEMATQHKTYPDTELAEAKPTNRTFQRPSDHSGSTFKDLKKHWQV